MFRFVVEIWHSSWIYDRYGKILNTDTINNYYFMVLHGLLKHGRAHKLQRKHIKGLKTSMHWFTTNAGPTCHVVRLLKTSI